MSFLAAPSFCDSWEFPLNQPIPNSSCCFVTSTIASLSGHPMPHDVSRTMPSPLWTSFVLQSYKSHSCKLKLTIHNELSGKSWKYSMCDYWSLITANKSKENQLCDIPKWSYAEQSPNLCQSGVTGHCTLTLTSTHAIFHHSFLLAKAEANTLERLQQDSETNTNWNYRAVSTSLPSPIG